MELREETTIVIEELHTQIEAIQCELVRANRAGLPREAYLHRARLEDLIDMARRHGIDVTAWVDHSLLQEPPPASG